MPFNCFRAARSDSDVLDTEPVVRRSSTFRAPMASLRRTFTASSTRLSSTPSSSRTCSNSSIARLPPCPHLKDPRIEALMMPAPCNDRPSRCLRISFPRIYSDIVTEMKTKKGCRDWRTFDVFDDDDIDDEVSAVEYGRKKAADYQRKMKAYNSF